MEDKGTGLIAELANSAGFWLLLFAGVGLLSLSVTEEKVQSKMERNHSRLQWTTDTESASVGAPKGQIAKSQNAGSQQSQGLPQARPENNKPYRYKLTGLRLVLAMMAAGGGLAVVSRLVKSRLAASQDESLTEKK